jgi:hypothetical protein
MSETPIYDALMDEFNSRRSHKNPLMEPHVDAKTLRKNIALKQEDEEPEYTRTSTGEVLTPTDSFLAKVEPEYLVGNHEERAAGYIVDPKVVEETTAIKIMARELTEYAKTKFASDYPNAAFMGLRDAHRNDDGSITLTVEGLERPSFDAESLTPEYTVKSLNEADLENEAEHHLRKKELVKKLDETQAMDFRGYFEKNEGE